MGVSRSIISHFTPYQMAHLITDFMFCGNLEEHGPRPESLLLKVSNISVAFPQNTKPGHRGRAPDASVPAGPTAAHTAHLQGGHPLPGGRPHRPVCPPSAGTVGSRPRTHCPWALFRMKVSSEKLLPRILYLRWALAVDMGNSGVEEGFLQYYCFLSFLHLESRLP